MDRIVEVKVNGNYITKDNKNAGVQGEYNMTALRIEFDEGWDGFAKHITWWNALHQNPVEVILTADLLEDLSKSTRIYTVLIPGEPLEFDGMCSFVIDGYVDGKRQRSVEDFLEVKPADSVDDAGKPVDPTPSQAEQLQVQIDALLGNMQAEAIRAETAAGAAEDAQEAAEEAQSKAEDAQKAAESAKTGAESAQKAAEKAKAGAEAAKDRVEDAQEAAETAKTGAENAQKAAEEAAVAAARSASNANSDAAAALAGADRAEDAQAASETAAAAASGSATAAASAATSAGSSAGAAQTAQGKAEDAQKAAESAKTKAETAKTDAETAKGEAEQAQSAAEEAKSAAETAMSEAAISEHNAEVWAEGGETWPHGDELTIPHIEPGAKGYAEQAAQSAAQAAQSAQEAGQSDWNENASTKASHILNRPFYREDVVDTLNLPVDTSGLKIVEVNTGEAVITYRLMLESVGKAPSAEELGTNGGTIYYQTGNEYIADIEHGIVDAEQVTLQFGAGNGNLDSESWPGITVLGGQAIVVHEECAEMHGSVFQIPGVYFNHQSNTPYDIETWRVQVEGAEFGGAYHPIPEEYLPKGVYGDNLEFDTETSLLWLTSDGVRIGEGIKVATSGGGGGSGESNNAVLTLKNTTGWMYKTISQGAECLLAYEWSSLEEDLATGNGVLKVIVNNTTKHTAQVEQGSKSVDVSPYLSAGENVVKLNVTDVYGNSRSLSFTLTVVALDLTSTFDSSVAYSGAIAFPYTPTAAVEKTVYFKVDGNEVGTATVTASGRQQTYTIPAQSHGAHQLEVWFTANVNGETVPSNHLYYTLICTEAGNNAPIIAVDWRRSEVEQYETLSVPYIVYDPASLTSTVSLHSSERGDQGELTVDRTKQTWAYRVENAGEVTLTLSCTGASGLSAVVTIGLTATETKVDVNAETEDLALHLTSYGRSNNEANPSVWSYGNVAAELTGFNYTSDGWMEDEQGITVLRVGGDARVEIPVQLFAQDFRTTGKTIEIEFASRSVLDYDAILATCWSGGRGFEITAQQATLKSEKSEVTTRYKEDDHLRLSFVIEKRSGNRLILGYVNGIISGMMQYPDSDDFSQAVPVTISLGSNDCTIDIYNIRVYDNDLDRFQMLNNWIADTQDLGEKKDRYDRNNIFDDYDRILPETLRPSQKYLVIDCPVLPTYKGDKKTCSGRYVDPVDEKNSFTFEGAEIDVQGTSSQFYYVKNFKIKFKGGFVQNGTTKTVYAMNAKAVPTAEFTFKADVASSEGANNVVLAEMYNELCPVKTPAQERDSRVRQTIEGHPIVVFHDDGSGAKFIGKYNFNNDKGTAEVFGFAEGDESWEIKENGNALVSFKTSDFTNWQTAFEARYPEDNTDITKLQQFVAWVASTNTEGKTGAAKQALLDKFKSELPNWVDVDDAIFYYLFTLIFLCIDQREKNAFPTWNAEMAKWLWLFYDADSSIGTDNKGNLTFEYWMEDIDFTEAGDPVFNGQNNVFWSNLRECFPDEIRDEYRRLRTELGDDGKALLSYDKVNELFTAHQSQWSEAIYNEDAWRKAVEPLEKVNDPQYLPMQQGKKEQHFKHWMYNRFRYLDSKFETGAALDDENRIMMRAHAQGNIWLTSYINMYGQVYYNSERSENRMVRDTAYEFPWTAQGAEDAVIGVNSAPMITSLGDLSPLMLEYCHIQYASHLTELKVGDAAADYVNDNFVALTLGNNKLLQKLDVRNCTALTQAVDASGCTNIEEVYFDGTSIAGLSLPNGGILKKLHLPGTITDLTLRNQTKLEEFVLPGYSNITTLRLENTPACVDGYAILQAIPANSRVRMIGFDWSVDSAEDILSFYDYLDTMRGLDENGNNVDKPQMQGSIRIDSLTGAQLAEMQSRYPSISIVYQHITSNLYFYDDTGSTLLYTAIVADGGDGSYRGNTPTKASTAQYAYSFSGWSMIPGGSVSSSALKTVTQDRNVYAVFTATVRKYTVTWVNNGATLETDSNVPYGTIPTYNGSTPVDGVNGLPFIRWDPPVGPITGNTQYQAMFKDQWADVAAAIADGSYGDVYKIGDTVPLNLGAQGVINMQIAAFDADTLADGTGKAAISWVGKELLKTKKRMNPTLVSATDDTGATVYTEGTGSIGGWEKCELRGYLQNNIKPLVPDSVVEMIQSVTKTQRAGTTTGSKLTQTTTDDVWIPSYEEMDNVNSPAAAFYFNGLFLTPASRVKSVVGSSTATEWWLRSYFNDSEFRKVREAGAFGGGKAYESKGIALGFCTGRSTVFDVNWKQSTTTTGTFRAIYCGDELWVAGSCSGDGTGLWYSSDAKNWTRSNVVTGDFCSVYYADGLWVAASASSTGLWYSEDGKTWTQSNMTSGSFFVVYHENGLWVAGGSSSNGLYSSTDGKSWTFKGCDGLSIRDIRYADGLWVACTMTKGTYWSADGETWNAPATADSTRYNVAIRAKGMWIKGSSSKGISYSTDGKTWTRCSGSVYSKTIYDIATFNTLLIACGSSCGIWYSVNGKDWTASNITTGSFSRLFRAPGGRMIAIGYSNNGVYYSDDGKVWTLSNQTTGSFTNAHYSNGVLVATSEIDQGLWYCKRESSGSDDTGVEVPAPESGSDSSWVPFDATGAVFVGETVNNGDGSIPVADGAFVVSPTMQYRVTLDGVPQVVESNDLPNIRFTGGYVEHGFVDTVDVYFDDLGSHTFKLESWIGDEPYAGG